MRSLIVTAYLTARARGLIRLLPDNLWIYALADEEEAASLFQELETSEYIDSVTVAGGMLTARRTAKLGREAHSTQD